MASKYIRYIGSDVDPESQSREGIFQLSYKILEVAEIPDYESDFLHDLLEWFRKNLFCPDRFSRSKSKKRTTEHKSISWFKSSATRHIDKAEEIYFLLERNGYAVDTVKADNVGYIVYEDDFQVSAIPFADR